MSDELFMRRALELAELGRCTVSPNPMVGCVIVRDGTVLGEGWHRRAGGPHAEIEALRSAGDVRGATMYVTLEPCCHHGRTGPCSEAVIAAGVSRVVIAMADPHEVVNGGGIAAIRAAGIAADTGVLEGEARRLNEKFVWAVSRRLPFVTLKAALTLDGKLATETGDARWISSERSREIGLALREEHDAILVGAGTVAADDPRLTRRLGLAGDRSWTRIVLDGDGSAPPQSRVFHDGEPTLLFTSRPGRHAPSTGLEIVETGERADLGELFASLYARGIHSLLVEGGAAVHAGIIRGRLWQKMVLFVAPMVVGGAAAPAIFSGTAAAMLADAHRFRFDRVEMVGGDLMITAYPQEEPDPRVA